MVSSASGSRSTAITRQPRGSSSRVSRPAPQPRSTARREPSATDPNASAARTVVARAGRSAVTR